jgi:hypothetical protein
MACKIATHNFDLYAGDACELALVYKDAAGNPITTITKATLTLKTYYGAVLTLQKVATLDAPNGKITFTFTGAETTSLVPVTATAIPEVLYIHDVEVELSVGLSPVTIIRGTATATGDVTK